MGDCDQQDADDGHAHQYKGAWHVTLARRAVCRSARSLACISALIALALVAATFVWTRNYSATELSVVGWFSAEVRTELEPIYSQYGPNRYSRNVEEWLIRDYFQDRRNGVFLDIGANHYRDESNTYYLETELGWSGVAIDALEECAADDRTHRPRTRFFALFASDVAGSTAQLYVPEENKLVASPSLEFTKRHSTPGVATEVPTTSLNAVLEQLGLTRIDFLSMDIALSEPKALAGFDIDRYQPALVCIEAHLDVRQQILDYFARHRYTVLGKYLRADPKNLYFMPPD